MDNPLHGDSGDCQKRHIDENLGSELYREVGGVIINTSFGFLFWSDEIKTVLFIYRESEQ